MRHLSSMHSAGLSSRGANQGQLAFIGTYTGNGSKGIYSYRFDPSTGKADSMGIAAETVNPSFLATHPSNRFLYAVNEVNTLEGKDTGAISAFEIDRASGKLAPLQQVLSQGAAPAYLSIDKSGQHLLVANYNGGNLVVFPIDKDGKLGAHSSLRDHVGRSVNAERQARPHPHCVATDNHNHFAISADLGTDEVYVYRFDPYNGSLVPNEPPFASVEPGSGPRHIAFSPSGKFLYLANELAGTVTVFAYDQAAGILDPKQTVSTLVKGVQEDNLEAEIVVDASGRFLYVSNRGSATDNIVVFRINSEVGTLSFVQRISSGGEDPRHIAIDPSGRWLFAANQKSHDVQLFHVEMGSGRLTPHSQVADIAEPVCIVFVPNN